MLYVKNGSGYEFLWPEGSEYIEVYHPKASFNDCPLDAIWAGDVKYNQTSLKQLANESSDYGRPYA